jgi:hypothetical protein
MAIPSESWRAAAIAANAIMVALSLTLVACARTADAPPTTLGPDASTSTSSSTGDLCTGGACIHPASSGCAPPVVTVRDPRSAPRPLDVVVAAGGSDGGEGCDGEAPVVSWTADAGAVVDAWTPPTTESYACPAGDVRVHVLDMWSSAASPTLGDMSARPVAVAVVDPSGSWPEYWAREDAAGCGWYSVCVPATLRTFELKAIGGADACTAAAMSGHFVVPASASPGDVWIDYLGTSATLPSDYSKDPAPIGASAFQLAVGDAPQGVTACDVDAGPPAPPNGFVRLHVRWPWGDPAATGFAGTDCESQKLGYTTPPYPTSLKIQGAGGGCSDLQATLDFQDGYCPWYTALVPRSLWSQAGGGAPSLTIGTPDWTLQTAAIPLPPAPAGDDLWLAYGGPPDNAPTEGVACLDNSTRPDQYHFYSSNPGPGYAHCGGDGPVAIDPCNPAVPTGYSPVHFRYLWAGQKTFTFFPSPAFMPKWITLEVNADEVTCFREADRPWFNCPVPNADFRSGATWRADDKTHTPEWNTVQQRPFPTSPGEYWIRWDYGKPDTTTGQFKVFTYYPDGSNGDWAATGQWNDGACAPKPPPSPVAVGYGYGGWFPYVATGYAYPFGSSLAKVYANPAPVQDLFNALVFERYEIWKTNYLETSALVCGAGTARVRTDPPQTVSEGQGYGIAISAAIGDKPTFDALWNFVRHYLSQSAKKYCGGLMGWMWDGSIACRPLDQPCDPDSGGCGGNQDSAFDGDVDIGIGLVFAALQWPEYTAAAVDWIVKMECEVNAAYDGQFNYPAPGDTWDKSCQAYPAQACSYVPGASGTVNLSYDPPGYFRVFGDFLAAHLDPATHSASDRATHQQFWYRTAQTVYRMVESCYDQSGVAPGLVDDFGHYATPCDQHTDNYNWSRALWRLGVDAAWFGNRVDLPEDAPGSSAHFPSKTQMQAKIDQIQGFYSAFHVNNPPEPNANMFSTICQNLTPAGTVTGCDPGFGHNSYFVNTALCSYASVFDDDGATTPDIRRQAIEEAISTTIENDRYYQESIGVYTLLFLTGNFPNPTTVP